MSRFITALAFLAVGVIFSPETFGSKSDDAHHNPPPKLVSFLKLVHLLCFSTSWGAALWVTFIGGIIMFKYALLHFSSLTTACVLLSSIFNLYLSTYIHICNLNCRNLPRHQFGNLQSKMFPAYFSLVGVCCAVSAASFGYLHPFKTASSTEKYQLGFLVAAFAFNFSNLVVFTPMTVEVDYYLFLYYFTLT